MMTTFYRTIIAVTLAAVLCGCKLFGSNEPEYLESVEAAPLKIPQGMTTPRGDSPVVIDVPFMRMPADDEYEPMPPRVVSTAGQQEATVFMSWSAEGTYLMVKDTPESVSRRLLYAIENSGMTLLKSDPSGAYKFHYKQTMPADEGFFSSMAFWRSGADVVDYSGTFMTDLRSDGMNTRVYLLFGNGEPVDNAGTEHILGIFLDRLG